MICTKERSRKRLKRQMMKVINGYTQLNTPLEKYLPEAMKEKFHSKIATGISVELSELINTEEDESLTKLDYEGMPSEEEYLSSNTDESESSGSPISCENIDSPDPSAGAYGELFPEWYLDEFRQVNICPSLNTLISLRAYFSDPQVEDYLLPHAGNIALSILLGISFYLGLENISYWSRIKSHYRVMRLEAADKSIIVNKPKLSLLYSLGDSQKEQIVYDALKIDRVNYLEGFPSEWKLYIMSVVYWLKKRDRPLIKPYHLHALIVTLITVCVIGSKIGHFWKRKTFLCRFGKKLTTREVNETTNLKVTSVKEAIEDVSEGDCVRAMDSLIQYFQVDNFGRRSNNFSRETIHLFGQLQSTFDLAVTLNTLLLLPFKRSNLSMFYNGTFLYNFTVNLKKRTDIVSYIEYLFRDQPAIVILYKIICDAVSNMYENLPTQKIKKRKPKNRKKTERTDSEVVFEDNSDDDFEDLNNKFCALLRSE